ncbi:hypothetical protein [Okeania sp. SIO2B3]|nr:hypothetical protein [Okeania sp. SIO2B3]
MIKSYHNFFGDARGNSLPIFFELHKMMIFFVCELLNIAIAST